MNLCRIFVYVYFLQLFLLTNGYSQEIASICRADIQNFSVQNYNAHRQNWSISQSRKSNLLYVGNSKGLLEYDGNSWKLYPFHQIIRSVMVDKNGTIYTGALGEFGYWKPNTKGALEYHSLKSLVDDKNFATEAIWNIIETKHGILFQSFAYVYILQGNKVKKITTPSAILFVQNVNERYIVGAIGKGLYEFDGNQFTLISGTEFLGKESIRAVLPTASAKRLLICTDTSVLVYDGSSFGVFNNSLNQFIDKNKLNKALKIGSNYLFGTILNGFVICDETGQIISSFNKENGLQDNTILSVFEDQEKNIWLGLDNGISMLSNNSPVKYFYDYDGRLGVLYDAVIYKKELYIGTNHGLFVSDFKGSFRLVPHTQGQVLKLEVLDNQLICGHNEGTFLIDNHNAVKISNVTGGSTIKKFLNDETLIQGTYTTLCIYKKDKSGRWQFSNIVNNFLAPIRQLEVDGKNVWVSKGFGGVSLLKLNDSLTKVVSETPFKKELLQITNLVKIGTKIIINDTKETQEYDALTQRFVPSQFFKQQSTILKTFQFDKLIVNLLPNGDLSIYNYDKQSFTVLPIRRPRWVDSYENIRQIDDKNLLFCLENGFAALPLNSIPQLLKEQIQLPYVREISVLDNPANKHQFSVVNIPNLNFKYNENNIEIKFAKVNYTINSGFSYFLEGYSQEWALLDISQPLILANLAPRDYILKIRSNLNNEIREFRFTVSPPWYWNIWSQIAYVFLLGCLVYILYRVHLQNLKKNNLRLKQIHRRRQELQQQEITKLRNQYLEENLIRKSEELANSTMALIKKNELLLKIKKEVVNHLESPKSLPKNQITDLIDRNISNQQDWKVFETNFNQVHEAFLKKLIQTHPSLSNGDLKLAAYLRMNLSSKEIAHLLNITVRSVELKRYRLRKKLEITNDENLSDYMMKFS
ncbi:MAG: hypothetical protein ACK4NY_05825 [Spirosomataceae bacterium]